MQYQGLKIMKDTAKNLIVVESDNNTFRFYDCTMEEVAKFVREALKDE